MSLSTFVVDGVVCVKCDILVLGRDYRDELQLTVRFTIETNLVV